MWTLPRAIDKLEKQGEEKANEEISQLGVSQDKIKQIFQFIKIAGSNDEILSQLVTLNVNNPLFSEGVRELRAVSEAISMLGVPKRYYKIDLTIARGLDYYTGTVYETILNKYPEIGSVCSGGRYDNLAEYYTDKKLPGVGTSIGLTRLFFTLKEAGIIGSQRATPSQVLVAQMGLKFVKDCLEVATRLRQNGINTEIYFDADKINKQIKYADKLKIPFVVIIGEAEIEEGKITLKKMSTGEQEMIILEKAIEKFFSSGF